MYGWVPVHTLVGCARRGAGGRLRTALASSLQATPRCQTAHIEDSGTEYTCFLLQVCSVCYVELTHAESTQNRPALRLR